MLKSVHKFHGAALCAFAMMFCDLISKPFTTMNVCDDGPYILMARTLARTGHVVYNGWAAAMIISQIYLAQPFIKLFGYSTTSVRMSTLLLAMATAFVFQRTLVRTGSSERNATLGTLAVVISPLYLMLSATFMTDITGLFATTLCLYGCVRTVRASSDRSAILWLCFAVITCALFGTSRQIAWLGNFVMVPSTLWLLRSRSRVLFAGALATAASWLFILGCMHWLARQPYAVPVPLFSKPFHVHIAIRELSYIILEIPFLTLPVIAVFAPRIFRTRPQIRFLLLAVLTAYVVIATLLRADPFAFIRLEPTAGYPGPGSLVTSLGVYTGLYYIPIFIRTRTLVVVTILCIGGLLGLIAVLLQSRHAKASPSPTSNGPSWKQLGILLLPFSIVYLLLLAFASGTTRFIFDRYVIELLGPAMIVLIRLYQERVRPSLPLASALLVIIMAAYGVIVTHNTFALDRARVDLANQLHALGIPYTSIDGNWDYNFDTELANSDHINNPLIKVPANAYVPPPPTPPGHCETFWLDRTPHVHPVYGISFRPDYCYGLAPFAPVQYHPWPFRPPINLYAVRMAPPA